jgi:putative Mg2+ transporter-C (MgtC) family protein
MDVTFVLEISAALLMGLAIGVERQFGQHPAGLRTNALVCVGAALFVSLSRLMDDAGSPTRIAAQVVSGIGFLGGGVILREGLNVKGMTTAATLWCSAAIGTLCGAGHPGEALIGTGIILGTTVSLHPFSKWIDKHGKAAKNVETSYVLRAICEEQQEGIIRTLLMRDVNAHPSMVIQGLSTQAADQPGRKLVVANIYSSVRDDHAMQDMMSRVNIEPSVLSSSWERLH